MQLIATYIDRMRAIEAKSDGRMDRIVFLDLQKIDVRDG